MKTIFLIISLNLLVSSHSASIDQSSTTVNVQQGGQEYSYSIRESHGEIPQDKQELKASSDQKEKLPQLELVKILQPQLHIVQIPQEQSKKGEGEQLVLSIPQEKGLVYPQFVKHGSGGFFHPLGFYFVPGVVRLV